MDLTLAIKYLDHCITKKYTQDSAIYNYLLQLYASLRYLYSVVVLHFKFVQG